MNGYIVFEDIDDNIIGIEIRHAIQGVFKTVGSGFNDVAPPAGN